MFIDKYYDKLYYGLSFACLIIFGAEMIMNSIVVEGYFLQFFFWIDFVSGYGTAADVPATVRQVALLMIADLYESRAATGEAAGQTEAFKMLFSASRSERGLF